jgi:hypothetical protein
MPRELTNHMPPTTTRFASRPRSAVRRRSRAAVACRGGRRAAPLGSLAREAIQRRVIVQESRHRCRAPGVLVLPLSGCVLAIDKLAKDIAKPTVSFEAPTAWDCTGSAKLPTKQGLEECSVCRNSTKDVQAVTVNKTRSGMAPRQAMYLCPLQWWSKASPPFSNPPASRRAMRRRSGWLTRDHWGQPRHRWRAP